MNGVGELGPKEPALRLPDRGVVRRERDGRNAPPYFGGVEQLVVEAVQAAGFERAGDHTAAGPARLEYAGGRQQRLARKLLELAPVGEGAAHQRHVGRMLGIAKPDGAALAMRGA